MLEAGATKERDLRLEVRRIRSGASRDRPGDVVCLDFMAPCCHLVDDVTVKSARTNTNVPRICVRLLLHGSLALGAHHGNLDADLRRSALLGTPSVQSAHYYYPFAIADGGRLAPMAAELVDRLTILVEVRRFLAWVLLTLAPCAMTIMSVCSISYVELLTFLFGLLGGMCNVNSCNVF
jgi:hypothetical protein